MNTSCKHCEAAGHRADEYAPPRPTVQEEAERLLSYWEIHGDNPEAVSKWAMDDLMGFLRFFAEGDES